jgi:TolB-like protein/DNA-binding CsgD family transcriptional regulator
MSTELTPADGLTARQFEILGLMAKGYSNPEICELLKISVNTVKVHVACILEALQVTNRTEAASVYYSLLNEPAPRSVGARARLADRIGCPAIAIIPLEEQPPSNDFFADGLVEDLILRLSAWRWFRVIASGASRSLSLRDHSLLQIREKVGADYVVTGVLRRNGGRARISISLSSTREGLVIWSESFDRDLSNLLATQDEISRVIVARIAPELLDIESRPSPHRTNAAPDAWRLATCGLAHLARRERARFPDALTAFDAAIAIDGALGVAHYGRAYAFYLAMVEQWLPETTAFPEFRRSASRAMDVDPGNSGSQLMCGLALLYTGDLDAAFTHVKEAATINPSSCLAHGMLGQMLVMRGRTEEGIASLEDALRLGPRDPGAWLHYVTLAMAHLALREFAAGIECSKHAIALRADSALPRVTLVACHQEAGDASACAAAVRDLIAQHPDFRVGAFLRLMRLANPDYVRRLTTALTAAGLAT